MWSVHKKIAVDYKSQELGLVDNTYILITINTKLGDEVLALGEVEGHGLGLLIVNFHKTTCCEFTKITKLMLEN